MELAEKGIITSIKTTRLLINLNWSKSSSEGIH